MQEKQGKTIEISKKAIIVSVVIVLILVFMAYALTFMLPKGEYQRDENGSIIQGTYEENPELEGISFVKFIFAPIMVLVPGSDGSEIVYVIMILMLVIGAIFAALDECQILTYLVQNIAHKFKHKKYVLLFVLTFVFMFLGSAVGMFEEFVPLVPIVVLLCYAMGWDALVGLGISILAGCFGFAAAVVNPFTVGVAQTIGGLELFSGIGLRLLTFALAYIILMAFMYPYAKKIEKSPQKSMVYELDKEKKGRFLLESSEFEYDKNKSRALMWFGSWVSLIIVLAVVSIFWHALANAIMYITIVIYIISGIGAAIICGVKGKRIAKVMGKGMFTLAPALIMILIACGVRYIISEGDIMDTILYKVIGFIESQNSIVGLLLIYLTVFVFEVFVPSGSAKALLIMPIIFDICSIVGIHPQIAVLCLAFGDGFSNVLLPTNAGLLLILGLTTVDYKTWIKWSLKIQLSLLAVTILILLFAHFVVYA